MRHRWEPGVRPFERGGIKFAIMKLLRDKPRHGYDIIRAMEEHSKGLYCPSAGAVYPVLQALEDQDLLTSTTEGGKRVYSVTQIGLDFLEEHKEEARRHEKRWFAHLEAIASGEALSAMQDLEDTFERMTRVVHATAGDPSKRNDVREVLEKAAREVKEIAER